jgi:hypothetical protein
MCIRRRRLSTRWRLGVLWCWIGVAFFAGMSILLLVEGLDLRHHSIRTTATVTEFYRTGHGGYRSTLTFTGPGGSRFTEATYNLASAPTKGARIPIYYVPGDPAEFQDARLGPPGVIELVFAAIIGTVTLVLIAGVIALPRYLIRMGAGTA